MGAQAFWKRPVKPQERIPSIYGVNKCKERETNGEIFGFGASLYQFNARTNGGKSISRDYLLFEPNRALGDF